MLSHNIKRHKRICKELKKDVNERDAIGVDIQANFPQKTADTVMKGAQSAGSRKLKTDYLEGSEDIPTFEESEFSVVKSLSNEN